MDDIDSMFSDLMDEIDLLAQTIEVEKAPSESSSNSNEELHLSIGFRDLNESLQELEESDLDALMADLVSDLAQAEKTLNEGTCIQSSSVCNTAEAQTTDSRSPVDPFPSPSFPPPAPGFSSLQPSALNPSNVPPPASNLPSFSSPSPANVPAPVPASSSFPAPSSLSAETLSETTTHLAEVEAEAQTKEEKVKLALEKLKMARVKKLVVKVLMSDGSSKTLMVDEKQTVRDVLDCLFEKTHCDCNVDWSLCERNPILHIERGFEDHEHLVNHLSAWTRNSENQVLFLQRPDKYSIFKDPQIYYLWKKNRDNLKDATQKDKELLLKDCFEGQTVIVPDLEGALFLKENGKKIWRRRYFLLRASGIYYVPKGKTKTSPDLVCFVQFDNVNVHYATDYKNKYKAPTDFCFVLKHPQIQRESDYIRFLCCDDEHTLFLWLSAIRVAKYGLQLYTNYQAAVRRAIQTSLGNSFSAAGTATGVTSNGHTELISPGSSLPQQNSDNSNDLTENGFNEPPPDFVPPSPPRRRLGPLN
ncbi:amyloid beta A4 precursor protein-binding family B member 1-interacting protein-like [Chanos chanos]|uniref:Amyloid beta A4 precursor protein-binding family B member 1-interacting protein n=1 Tax=Chanos chanos TaxID=29144 RepID=A0A6J2VFQ5_CHACN|nr:amyloid beta A4 precursor protein-binding family B member 1-interacting protein-like [Chanos chanos]